MRAARRALSLEERARQSHNVYLQLCQDPDLLQRPLCAYAALVDELSCDELIQAYWAAGKAVYLPRVQARYQLTWHCVTCEAELVTGSYGIREPHPETAEQATPPEQAYMLIPGLAFDQAHRRLGQGGGFYDNVIPQVQRTGGLSIGLGFSCQLIEEVPHEAHDAHVDRLCLAEM